MALERVRLEVDRVMNLVTGFGWSKVKEEILEDKIVLTIEKRREPPAEAPEAGAG